jgi:hypothetical protein
MNIIRSEPNVRPWRVLRGWLAFTCATALVVSAAVAASNFERDAGAFSASPEPSGFNVSNTAEPAIAVIYQAAESEGLVPDEYRGGFRSPASLRERLQAQRGEFSNALR